MQAELWTSAKIIKELPLGNPTDCPLSYCFFTLRRIIWSRSKFGNVIRISLNIDANHFLSKVSESRQHISNTSAFQGCTGTSFVLQHNWFRQVEASLANRSHPFSVPKFLVGSAGSMITGLQTHNTWDSLLKP